MTEEEKLIGGNVAASVVRLGATVRKPATAATPAVQALLAHLHAVGCKAAPRSFGLDERGRQVLEFIPGAMWDRKQNDTLADLRRVGVLIRTLHDSSASFTPPALAVWEPLSSPEGNAMICHNDLAPWNLVCGADRWVFIDWDNAGPGTRLWDLAWATLSFPPLEPGCDLLAAARAVVALVQGYGLEPSGYGELIRLMVVRARACASLLADGAQRGEQPWVRLYAEGHAGYWGPVSDYISRHGATLEAMMMSLRAD